MVVDTSARLTQLRAEMKKHGLDAYYIPSEDAHMSEYLAPCDQLRAYISGFDGSAGLAVVTQTQAALWTDGRYFLQASQQLDEGWMLMKMGVEKTPSAGKWLCQVLEKGQRVGFDATTVSQSKCKALRKELKLANLELVSTTPQNLVRQAWNELGNIHDATTNGDAAANGDAGLPARCPPRPDNALRCLTIGTTGKSVGEKFTETREAMTEKGANMLIVSALDEIAWLLNLRGTDIDFNPVFFSYVVLTQEQCHLFVAPAAQTTQVKEHLSGDSVQLHDYDEFFGALPAMIEESSHVLLSNRSSEAIVSMIPKDKRVLQPNPITLAKALKNETELEGMRAAHRRDGVALCAYFCWLEEQLASGATLDEVDGSDQLQRYREEQEGFVSLSFPTISSVGGNGSIIHYRPMKGSCAQIVPDKMYLCDSGAQYIDGTTDVTRTVHFGEPTQFQRECFTRVLKGHIGLATLTFPNNTNGHCVDAFARKALWDVGLDYRHGTGHGVGAFLNVHEGPQGITPNINRDQIVPLQATMCCSNEPGYYEDGEFGIRIETIVIIVPVEREHNFGNKGFLGFETITMTPIQTKLVVPSLLTQQELQWLNDYNAEVYKTLKPLLEAQGKEKVLQWLARECEAISPNTSNGMEH
eukprot:Clim_evm39s242 gene=Clim_evmTU39s242